VQFFFFLETPTIDPDPDENSLNALHPTTGGVSMDVIEEGFSLIMEKIQASAGKREELVKEVRAHDELLLQKMGERSAAVVQKIGLNMLQKGKQDTRNEVYDAQYFKKKMIVLGKTEPMEFRPDDAGKKVADQFCVLAEDGKFYELMYSSNGFLIDTYLNPLTPAEAIETYGYEVMFMLYRAMRDYMQGETELLDALEKVLAFLFPEDRNKKST
jgi:hypothetical protein